MSMGPNPPLPGRGIAPENSPQTSEPPFNRAADGRTVETPPEVPRHDLNLRPPEPAPGGAQRPPAAAPVLDAAPAPERAQGSQARPILTGPDGMAKKEGPVEDKRQRDFEARMEKMNDQFEKDGGATRDRSQLGRDFDNAHYHRQ